MNPPKTIFSAFSTSHPSPFTEISHQIVSHMLTDTKSLPPLLLLDAPNDQTPEKSGILISELPPHLLENSASKSVLADMVKGILKERPSNQSLFITEAWSMKAGTPAEYITMTMDGRMSVSELPKKYREEIIMYQYSDMRVSPTVNWMGKAVFERDDEGNVLNINDPEWINTSELAKKDGGVSRGKFSNLAPA